MPFFSFPPPTRLCPSLGPFLAAFVLLAAGAFASTPPLVLDPAASVSKAWGAEWDVAGDAGGWTPSNATISVADGLLAATATTTGATPALQLSGFASGPDLDLGFNDFLELRLRLPAGHAGPVRILYGTTFSTGISAARELLVPADAVPADGEFHVYRLELGLEVFWRATLRDLRVELPGLAEAGARASLDYLRVGDEPGALVYQPRVNDLHPNLGGAVMVDGASRTVTGVAESKHFRYIWDAQVAAHPSWTATMPRNTLRNLEESWQIFARKLGYREPCFAIGSTTGTRRKVNVTSWYGGYWAGVDDGYGKLNITPDGLRENPPTGVIPHELMHVFQFHNTSNYVPGSWWEGHANYGRERYLQHFGVFFPANQRSGIDPTCLRCAHQHIAHGRDYYLSWPLFLYLDENPDGLPDLGEGTLVKLWQQTRINEYPLMTLERLTPSSSLKDIVGLFARRQATLDYSSQADIRTALAGFGPPLDNTATARWQFTDLVRRPDASDWWRVPHEMAPMQGAYALHELVPAGSGAGRVVTVNLRGLPDSARGADWRQSFVVVADDGSERYGPLAGPGENSVTLAANENKLYLSVAGAPAVFHTGAPDASFEGDFNNALYPYRSTPSKTRFPYELQVEGATPRRRDSGTGTAGLVRHANGGGYRASTATIAATAYVGPDARVLGTANVSGFARIEDFAVVSGNASVSGNAVVSGHAWVRGGSVTGDAKVRDWALVEGGTLSGRARVLERGNFKGGSATDLATVKGSAATLSGALTGNAIIDGDYGDFFSGRDVADAVAFGHQPYVGVPDSFLTPLPAGLYASYDFAASHDSRALDQFGVTDAFTVGSPAWIAADARRKGFLNFDGATQHLLLDRSVADLRDLTFTAWVKPLGGAANQALLWLGAAPTRRLVFTPDDGAGSARFRIVNGGAEQTLAAPAPPPGVWTHVAISLDSAAGTGALYLDGVLAASGPITIRPDQLLAPNTADGLQHNYLARAEADAAPRYRGALDEVRFYGAALSAADIAALQPATTHAAAGALHVDLRADDASAGAATWTNRAGAGDFTRVGSPTRVANVGGSGLPGVFFDGVSAAYTGPLTGADLHGASDRSVEVWAYNPALVAEETMVSWGHRGTARRDFAFNFGNNPLWGAATHWDDDVGWGASPPAAGQWQHLVYTYDGATTVRVFINGRLANTKTLAGPLDTFASEVINLGCQRDSAGGGRSFFFNGYLNTVRVHGGVLTETQIAANHLLGPSGAAVNVAPTLAPLGDLRLDPVAPTGGGGGSEPADPVVVTLTLGDTDTPLAALSVWATSSNAALLPGSALRVSGEGATRALELRPAAGAGGSATVAVTVSDGAATSTREFVVSVRTAAESWRWRNFGTEENAGDAADTADPDGDGVVNLLERACAGDPLDAAAAPLPRVDAAAAPVSILYQRSTTNADLVFAVEESVDLVGWSPAAGEDEVVQTRADHELVRHTRPMGADARVFLRLRVGAE